MHIEELLKIMIDAKASDLHLKAGSPPILRINEQLVSILEISSSWSDKRLTSSQTRRFAQTIMTEKQFSLFEETLEADLAYTVTGLGRFRVNTFCQRGSVGLVFRFVPFEIPKFEELNLPLAVTDLAEEHRGLVLVTGTARSGKSTTLAAMLDHINSTRKCNIVTLEDPIEFLHRDKLGIVNQREIGMDTRSFADALKQILRQDPDVLLIGEMRDLETISSALTAAETGHLVFSTLHTIDAPQTVERIINFFPPYQHHQLRLQLSMLLRGIISQRLLPRCDEKGLIPAVEIMKGTALIQKLIAEDKISQIRDAMTDGSYYGMQTFNQSLAILYQQKKISYKDALAQASNPEELKLLFKGIYSGTYDFVEET